MAVIYDIRVVQGELGELAADEERRGEFRRMLNEHGTDDWEVVQISQVGRTLLVFMKRETP